MRFIVWATLVCALASASCQAPPVAVSPTALHATIQAAVVATQVAGDQPDALRETPPPAQPPPLLPFTPPTRVPTPTETPRPTATPTPSPKLNVLLLGCNTGLDLAHGMGEVTNAYVTLRNIGTVELTNVCATLNANDEGKRHPDKTRCAQFLPPNTETTFKLTADTTFRQLTFIEIAVVASPGVTTQVTRADCRELDRGQVDALKKYLDTVIPSPK